MADNAKLALEISGRLLPALVAWLRGRLMDGEAPEDVEAVAEDMFARAQENRELVDEFLDERFPLDTE